MKKILFSAILLLLTCSTALASMSDDRAVTFDQLPQKAQQFIKQHFTSEKIAYAKQDTDLFDGDYKVYFTGDNKVEFRKNGEWKEVECKTSEVPAGIVPQRMNTYITENHPNLKVVKIDRDSRDYELKLSNGTELKFNLKGDFIGYDN